MNHDVKFKADAVIFDKDGTLMDFDAFWITLSSLALRDVLHQLDQSLSLADDILTAFGVQGNTVDVNGILCKGTYREMSEAVQYILVNHGCNASVDQVEALVLDAYSRHAHESTINPTCPNLRQILETLKHQHKKIALVTTDNAAISALCLEKLGIADLFDCLYSDNGAFPPKPDPAAALDLCAREGLNPQRVVMVGDTMTDVRFARNAGLRAVAVANCEARRAQLTSHADTVIPDVSHLLKILE